MTASMAERIQRDMRILKLYAAISSLTVLVLVGAAFRPPRQQAFDIIDVKRINVLNDAGTPALVIAGRGRLPGPTVEGNEYAQELSGGRPGASGMIFFNERGDEVGGLTFHGRLDGDGYQAGAGLMFDQFHQDQVVGLQYQDDGTARSAGLHVWDRSTEVSIARLLELVDLRRTAVGPARDSVEAVLRRLASSGLGAHRIFLGSQERTAALRLADAQGRPRLRLSVDSTGVARVEFLDEDGNVTREISD
jgi:hypothetical protein